MTESSRIERAREFVRKYNNGEYDFVKNPSEDQLDTLHHLIGAKEDFEKADEYKRNWKEPTLKQIDPEVVNLNRRTMNYNFENTLEELLIRMGMAKVSNLYSEGGLKKENEELNDKNNNFNKLNGILADENVRFRNTIIKIFNDFPEVEDKYGWILEKQKEESKLE